MLLAVVLVSVAMLSKKVMIMKAAAPCYLPTPPHTLSPSPLQLLLLLTTQKAALSSAAVALVVALAHVATYGMASQPWRL